MARFTPTRNRVSIINLASKISSLWSFVFASTNKSVPESTDRISILDSSGDPYYVTVSQLIGSGSGPVQLPSYLSTALPSASPAGQLIYISDEGVMAYSNGSVWIS